MSELTLYAADNGPVAWRLARLAAVFQQAESAALLAPGDWGHALHELSDIEGELAAVWRTPEDKAAFAGFIDRAWAAQQGEANNAVEHRVSAPDAGAE